ncbi:MAG: alpha/beta hydrolase family protein [Nitrososphaerota archaeon]|nr:alpha/beta hydrolase family protein [Candidatus Bathyarchaeota archaeon]MDW8049004.1 alpha/beta hydrolase family protein [Nitrososphaerota archaeon]
MKRLLQPQSYFRSIYKKQTRTLGFQASDIEEWLLWRPKLRCKLAELLNLPEGFKINFKVVSEVSRPGFLMQKVLIETRPHLWAPLYILIPENINGKAPAVIALHGHGYGKDEISGITEEGKFRDSPEGIYKDFAVQLVRMGLLVAVPDQFAFGERRNVEDVRKGRRNNSCHLATVWAFMLGSSMVGFRVWDVMKIIDYLQQRSEVDARRIGGMGLSAGGTTLLYASAIDERIRVSVLSGSFCTFFDSILAMNHCICNYVPALLMYAEIYDIASLIAPRPLLIEAGINDPIFPINGVLKAYLETKKAYHLLNVGERLALDLFDGGHEVSGCKAFPWIMKWLSIEEPDILLMPM